MLLLTISTTGYDALPLNPQSDLCVFILELCRFLIAILYPILCPFRILVAKDHPLNFL
jgi:hypothetical protein